MFNRTAPRSDTGMLPNYNYGASIIILKTMYEFLQRADFVLDCEQRLYLGKTMSEVRTTGAYQTFNSDPTNTVVTGSKSGATATVSQVFPTRNIGNTVYYYNNIDFELD